MVPDAPIAPTAAPPVTPAPLRATRAERWTCAVLAAAGLAVLGVAAWLDPSPDGVGTHRALGLAPCGWMVSMNLPCPSCGMTTAFSHAAHGSFLRSAFVQPMGFVLAIGTAAGAVTCLHTALTGSRLAHVLGSRITARALLALGILALLAWGWKVALVRGALPAGALHHVPASA